MSDEGWSDEEEPVPTRPVIGTYIVTKDYIPPHNNHLTLELDHLVYVFSKQTDEPGFWEGDANGIIGIFPSSHVKEHKI